MVVLGKLFLVLVAVVIFGCVSSHGLILDGLYINTVSLNGSIPYTTTHSRVEHQLVEIQCNEEQTTTTTVVAHARTDYMGRFDFYFRTIQVPKFNPVTCEVVVKLRNDHLGVGIQCAKIVKETIARTTEGAQAYFHSSPFMLRRRSSSYVSY